MSKEWSNTDLLAKYVEAVLEYKELTDTKDAYDVFTKDAHKTMVALQKEVIERMKGEPMK